MLISADNIYIKYTHNSINRAMSRLCHLYIKPLMVDTIYILYSMQTKTIIPGT